MNRIFSDLASNKIKDLLIIILLGALTAAFMWRIVLLHQIMLPIDTLYKIEPWQSETPESKNIVSEIWNPNLTDEVFQGYPNSSASWDSLRKGEYLWDPTIFSGMPSMARGNFALFPIFSMLNFFLSTPAALNWTKVLGLFLAGTFTYLFLRELGLGQFGALVGSLAFSYNAYLINWLSLTFFFSTMIWLPLLFLGVERALQKEDWRWNLISALGFAMQLLAGNFQFALFSAITLLLFYAWRGITSWIKHREIGKFSLPPGFAILSLITGALIAAPQVLLTVELFLNSNRNIPIGAGSYLDPKTHLIRLIAPLIYGNDVLGQSYLSEFNYPETSIYFGVLPLFLIVFSLLSTKKTTAAGMIGIGLLGLLAVYSYPFRQFVQYIYPLFTNSFPGRIFFITAFCFSVAAGIGADALSYHKSRRMIWIVLGVSILLIVYLLQLNSSQNILYRDTPFYQENLRLPILWLIGTSILLFSWGISISQFTILKTLAIILIISDLFSLGINYNSTFQQDKLYPVTKSLKQLSEISASEDQPFRILNVNSELILPGNVSKIYGLQTASGYSSWVPKRYSEYINLTHHQYPSLNKISLYNCCSPLINALNIKYIYSSAGTIPESTGIYNLSMRMAEARTSTDHQDAFGLDFWNIQGTIEAVLIEIPPSQIVYEIEPKQESVFKAGLFIDPNAWEKQGEGVTFEVYIAQSEEDSGDKKLSRHVDLDELNDNPFPIPIEIDLSTYQGRKVYLILKTKAGTADNREFDIAGWVSPRIEGYSSQRLQIVYEEENKIYKNLDSYPRTWIVHQIVKVPKNNLQEIKKYLRKPDFNLSKKAVIEADVKDTVVERFAPLDSTDKDRARISEYSDGRVELHVSLSQPGVLILSDNMYPGWKVEVDGINQPILTANLIMRAVQVSSGEHVVVFKYQPDLFKLGLSLSIVTMLIYTFLCLKPAAVHLPTINFR